MAHTFIFGTGDVAHQSFSRDGHPAFVMAFKSDLEGLLEGQRLADLDGAVVIEMLTPEAAFAIIDMVMQSVQASAIVAGVDPELLTLPLITIADHDKIVADLNAAHSKRVIELLEANNTYQQEARDARALLSKKAA